MFDRSTAQARFEADRPFFEERGVYIHGARAYLTDDIRQNYNLGMDQLPRLIAMDAQPALVTDPNSAVPMMLTTWIDPAVYEVVFAPNTAVEIFGEQRKGDWLTDTAMFPVAEHTGEVSSYGDYNENGRAGVNLNWPNFQAYLWQVIMQYGERELERAGLARINYVSEIQRATATVIGKYANLTYLFGVQGLQNYGLANDPDLPSALTPATKAAGGTTWFTSGGSPNATANEVYNDIVALFQYLVVANQGLVDKDEKLILAMSPQSTVALTFTNSFAVNVEDLLKKNFKNLRVVSVPQYGAVSAANPQGSTAGNLVQMWAEDIEGQDVGFCAFNEKMRSHPLIRRESSFRQKVSAGSWGAIIRMPVGVSQMLGV